MVDDSKLYHWMHDSLKRLYGILEYLPDDTGFIVPSDLGPVERETLLLLGIDGARLAPFAGNEIWELDTLFFSTPTSNSGTHWRNADLWLKDRILDGYGISLFDRATVVHQQTKSPKKKPLE